jgi:hypothetical protein
MSKIGTTENAAVTQKTPTMERDQSGWDLTNNPSKRSTSPARDGQSVGMVGDAECAGAMHRPEPQSTNTKSPITTFETAGPSFLSSCRVGVPHTN